MLTVDAIAAGTLKITLITAFRLSNINVVASKFATKLHISCSAQHKSQTATKTYAMMK